MAAPPPQGQPALPAGPAPLQSPLAAAAGGEAGGGGGGGGNSFSSSSPPPSSDQPKPPELDDNFFYPVNALESPARPDEMPKGSLNLYYSFGLAASRRYNLHYLAESTVVTAVGNVLILINLRNMDQDFVVGRKGVAIGAIAVHPSCQFIAVAEKSRTLAPQIYVYSYPALKLHRVLGNGTSRSYSHVAFNGDGTMLASVGSDPDYTLALWDWKQERIILHSKAFSQDVYNVTFSPDNGGELVTSGVGHIKFWKMSGTFTGLKLKGQLGKFGASELTDVAAFVQLPDGKVLSSTETGNLLLWDGGLIKCEIAVKGKRPCHQGCIEVCMVEEGEILTAGEDGYVRVWDSETVDNADVVTAGPAPAGAAGTSQTQPGGPAAAPNPPSAGAVTAAAGGAGTLMVAGPRIFEIEPLDEISVGRDVKIKSMVKCPGAQSEYLIQDAAGNIWRLDIKKRTPEKVMSFHAGSVSGMDASPLAHTMVSLGSDGTIRVHDYVTKAVVGRAKYPGSGSCLAYLPTTLDPTGTTVAAGFEDGVLRFIQHDFHFIGATNLEFRLTHVMKPHNQAVLSVAFSSEGDYMATASAEKTIFFFQIRADANDEADQENDAGPRRFSREAEITPIGFVQLDCAATSVSWVYPPAAEEPQQSETSIAGGREKVAATLADGTVHVYEVPSAPEVTTEATFRLEAAQLNRQVWHMDWSRVREAEAAERKAAAEKAGQERKERGEQDQPAEAEPRPAEAEEVEAVDDTQGAGGGFRATGIWCLEDGNRFLLALQDNNGQGHVRVCALDNPGISRILLSYTAPITTLRLSHSRRYIVCGAKDGADIIKTLHLPLCDLDAAKTHEAAQPAAPPATGRPAGSAHSNRSPAEPMWWHGHVHDEDKMQPAAVVTTFDDAFVCSAGCDGGLFVFRMTMEDIKKSEAMSDAMFEEKPVAGGEEDVQDITDPNAYSIQRAKLELEKDKELQEAEQKKQGTRNTIQELRREFLSVAAESAKLPLHQQIPRSDLVVDPQLVEDIHKRTEERVRLARKELEWISAKESIGPTKLRKKFLDDIQTDHIEIRAIKSGRSVASFRTTKPAVSGDAMLSAVQLSKEGATKEVKGKNAGEGPAGRGQAAEDTTGPRDKGQAKHARHLDSKGKHEARKQLRAERAAQWKQLLNSKPDEHYEDPKDVAAIRYAETHMGDYKLKSGANYIVPESERVDADKKNRQLVLLHVSLLDLKEHFNVNVLNLRDRKRRLVDQINLARTQVQEIDAELGTPAGADLIPKAEVESSAYPENRYNVDAADVEQLKIEQAEALKRPKDDFDDLAGGFGGGKKRAGAGAPLPPAGGGGAESQPPPAAKASAEEIDAKVGDGGSLSNLADVLERPPSSAEEKEAEIKRTTLTYRKERIIKAVNQEIDAFDQAVAALGRERLLLEADIKSADMKLTLLCKEWALLKEFAKYDNVLAEKLATKRAEKDEIDNKINECQEKLTAKKSEVEQVIQREREIQDEFKAAIGEDNKYEELLTKIYRRKIKRAKKKTKNEKSTEGKDGGGGGGGQEEEEEDEDDESDFDSDLSDDEESEQEGFDETCPADADPATWKRVLEMRERRFDQEDVLGEIQKAIEALKKDNDALIKKERVIGAALKNAEAEIQAFQTQKQRKLNELDVVVPLRLHQMQYLENDALPTDLSPALVFVNSGLRRLKERIKELQQEKIDIRKQHKQLKKSHVSLIKSRKEKQAKLAELEARAYDVQMLKFGQIIDLDKLERMGVNKNADELREKLQREDNRRAKEIEAWDAKVTKLKVALTQVVSENTTRLEQLIAKTDAKRKLEAALNYSQSTVTAEYSGLQKKDIRERDELIQFVRSQAQEIEQLKREIQILIT